jgi:hypothetical protein
VTVNSDAHARSTDRQESHDAARSVGNVTKVKGWILELLAAPMHDEELVRQFNRRHGSYVATAQSIRSRRAELVKAGLVVDTGDKATTSAKRKTTIWKAAAR